MSRFQTYVVVTDTIVNTLSHYQICSAWGNEHGSSEGHFTLKKGIYRWIADIELVPKKNIQWRLTRSLTHYLTSRSVLYMRSQHGSSEGHSLLKWHGICCSIAGNELIPKICRRVWHGPWHLVSPADPSLWRHRGIYIQNTCEQGTWARTHALFVPTYANKIFKVPLTLESKVFLRCWLLSLL